MQLSENLYERLRHLAVEDPREERSLFLQLLDSGGPALDHFLGRISSAADGRLRHLVANALRNHRDRERLAPHLIAWHEIETDEFTRRAIAAASGLHGSRCDGHIFNVNRPSIDDRTPGDSIPFDRHFFP